MQIAFAIDAEAIQSWQALLVQVQHCLISAMLGPRHVQKAHSDFCSACNRIW